MSESLLEAVEQVAMSLQCGQALLINFPGLEAELVQEP